MCRESPGPRCKPVSGAIQKLNRARTRLANQPKTKQGKDNQTYVAAVKAAEEEVESLMNSSNVVHQQMALLESLGPTYTRSESMEKIHASVPSKPELRKAIDIEKLLGAETLDYPAIASTMTVEYARAEPHRVYALLGKIQKESEEAKRTKSGLDKVLDEAYWSITKTLAEAVDGKNMAQNAINRYPRYKGFLLTQSMLNGSRDPLCLADLALKHKVSRQDKQKVVDIRKKAARSILLKQEATPEDWREKLKELGLPGVSDSQAQALDDGTPKGMEELHRKLDEALLSGKGDLHAELSDRQRRADKARKAWDATVEQRDPYEETP